MPRTSATVPAAVISKTRDMQMQPLPRTGGKASAERNQSEDLPWKNRIYVSLKNTRRMNTADICIIKRDGKREDFSASKISNAIGKAFQPSGLFPISNI